MGDNVNRVPPAKEHLPSLPCPMLTSTNYAVWAMKMKSIFKVYKVWEVIDPGTTVDENKDSIATALLFQALPEELTLQIGNSDSAKEMWETIKSRNQGADRVKEARLQTLMSEFEALKMKEPSTVADFAGKISGMASRSASLGTVIEEEKLVKRFLHGLPKRFIHMVASLEQSLNLKTVGFDDVVGRLIAYEERVKLEENDQPTKGDQLLLTYEEWEAKKKKEKGYGRGKTGAETSQGGRGLGHLNFEALKSLSKHAIGLPTISHPMQICDSCIMGKQTRAAFQKKSLYRATDSLQLLYADVCGPITPKTNAGNQYILLVVDDFSRYMWVTLIKTKDQVPGVLIELITRIENDFSKKVKALRTDNGGEFTSHVLGDFCKHKGITRQFTAPYTPQQNGVVERRNRTILGTTRSMLKAKWLPQIFWGEAVHHSIYLLNRSPTKALENSITSYEKLKGRKPDLSYLKVFGCLGFVKDLTTGLKKLDDRGVLMVHLGSQPGKKYRMFDPIKGRVHVARSGDIKFDETKSYKWEKYLKGFDTSKPGWKEFIIHAENSDQTDQSATALSDQSDQLATDQTFSDQSDQLATQSNQSATDQTFSDQSVTNQFFSTSTGSEGSYQVQNSPEQVPNAANDSNELRRSMRQTVVPKRFR
ncbi:putative RNA-directed DNA polymerase [Helianthus annuus]|nr:putative RNA-directed DNA polymerase [Helianthus annuus]